MPTTLRTALTELAKCAKKVAASAPSPLTAAHAEIQVGIGTCHDLLSWASRLRRIDFGTPVKRKSKRALSYLESTRFTYVWSGANALFSRDRILSKFTTHALPTGELARFRILFQAAVLSAADEGQLLGPLQDTLRLVRNPQAFPWAPLAQVRIIDLIYYKYTPGIYQQRGDAAKAIQRVATGAKPLASLDLPTLVYATRNWILHGALLDSSFRGSPRDYQTYLTAATEALARILAGAALTLHTLL